jgi:hypothetical protein
MIRALAHAIPFNLSSFAQIEIPISLKMVHDGGQPKQLSTMSAELRSMCFQAPAFRYLGIVARSQKT